MQFNIVISETLLIPILICRLLFLEINGLHISYNVGFNTECVDGKLAFLQIIQIALDQCVVECARRKKCRGISYRERFTLCNLIDVDNPPYLSSTPADCVLVNKKDMKYELLQTCNDCGDCDLDTGKCIITECPKLALDDVMLVDNTNSIGSRVKYTCYPGFMQEKADTYATCQDDGTWSFVPRCVVAECPKLTFNDGTLLSGMNSIGSRVTYMCKPGFKRETVEDHATCQSDRTWSVIPRCVVDVCYHNPCKNSGTCIATATDQYTCTCTHGFTGPNCEIAIIVCEGGEMELRCPDGKVIEIISAKYGRTKDASVCFYSGFTSVTDCDSKSSFQIVDSTCSGKPSCLVYVENYFLGGDPFSEIPKYLEIDYRCI